MPDTVTEVTSQSWGSRLKGSFMGILIGLFLILGSCWFLFKNEGRAVGRYRALKEGGGEVVSVASSAVNAANEGRLVHTTGSTETADFVVDREFGISAEAIHLERRVEMYQWQESQSSETRKKTGGGTETTTTYSYSQGWSERLIDSSAFKEPRGHENPASMPFRSRIVTAEEVSLGAFTLSPGLVQRIGNWEPLPIRSTSGLPDSLRGRARLHRDGLYLGPDPAAPRVGDLRISFRQVPGGVVSVVARQAGGGLSAYQTRSGGSIELLRAGRASAEEMFEAAKQANKVLTWILRLVGFLLMMIGFRMVLAPFAVLADVLPALGNLVERGVNGLALGLALPLSLLVIGLAWLFHRPLLAIGVLAVTAGLAFLLLKRVKRARRLAAATAPPPPPPPPSPPAPTTG